jgi:predicted acetyltransferase
MKTINLIETNSNILPQLEEILADLDAGENGFYGTGFNKGNFNIKKYIQELLDESKGINLEPGLVPQTTYWLYEENEIIGISRLRHMLTQRLIEDGGNVGYFIKRNKRGKGYGTNLLKLTIIKANEIGISEILLTPNSANLPSLKVIENNGGKFEDERTINGRKYKRYWIRN